MEPYSCGSSSREPTGTHSPMLVLAAPTTSSVSRRTPLGSTERRKSPPFDTRASISGRSRGSSMASRITSQA
ncbi:hypothetical protein ACFPRL_31450 [Pseudoclavibacter helvolus]